MNGDGSDDVDYVGASAADFLPFISYKKYWPFFALHVECESLI